MPLKGQETKEIVKNRNLNFYIDGNERRDPGSPLGFMDVPSFSNPQENYRILLDVKKRYILHPIDAKKAGFKPKKVIRKAMVENYCSSLLMTLVNSVVIPFLIALITKVEEISTRVAQEKSIMSKNLFFLTMCCVILPLLSLTTIRAFINNIMAKDQFINTLENIAHSLVTQSLYFINYAIQTISFSNFLSFLTLYYLLPDILKLLMQWVFSKLYSPYDSSEFQVGYNSALVITNFTYCLFFAISSPIINIFAVLLFYTKYYIDLYNLTHSYAFRTKSPLEYGNSLIGATILSSLLFIIGMACYFALNISILSGSIFLGIGILFIVLGYNVIVCDRCNIIKKLMGQNIQDATERTSEMRLSVVQMDEEYMKQLVYLYQTTYEKFKEIRTNDILE